MRIPVFAGALLSVCLSVLSGASALAQSIGTPPAIKDLINANEEWATDQLRMRGWSPMGSQYNDVYWWNARSKECVVVTHSRGRVIEISRQTKETCRRFHYEAPVQLPSQTPVANTPAIMMAICRNRAHQILRAELRNIDTKYEGQRTDGTHAVNGDVRLIYGVRERFQCSFNRNGSKIVNFVVIH
jgi:hypothetical protein